MTLTFDEKTRSSSNFFNNKGGADECLIVIFGGSGDLAKRKLFPALGNLMFKKMMPAKFQIIAVGRKPMETKELLSMAKYPADFEKHFLYLQTHYDAAGIQKLKETCDRVCKETGIPPNYLFYLAIPPQGYAEVALALKQGGMVHPPRGGNWSRLVVEKPYGKDIGSATELNENLLSCFAEKQIYRIDHYLGKESVQNLLVFRFANSVFEAIWNHNYIEHVQISHSEFLGAEDRAEYFDQAGLLRDMIQNHLMQILCLVTMEPPVGLSADSIRDEKVKVLRSLRPLDLAARPPVAVRGQYGEGVIKEKPVIAYREGKGIKPESSTETFVAMRMNIDNFRWAGVPFYLRSGKRLGRKGTEVVVTFKKLPRILFNKPGVSLASNRIVFKIQPQEAILLELTTKNPGQSFELSDTSMNFCYSDHFDTSADAYERLLLDAVLGDPTLFVRSDETELSWKFLDPLLKNWGSTPAGSAFPNYAAGSEGPADAAKVLLPNSEGEPTEWIDFEKYDNVCPPPTDAATSPNGPRP
ncbi:MAG: glucose-6-phosphate dehydrogenase [Fibrobacteres bacterium]|jgi:glucose-6-phosphate 1-dehydrogenase|nr:glucose-6-phosphate dehydrogenase [Fibrobacterota bacterium]